MRHSLYSLIPVLLLAASAAFGAPKAQGPLVAPLDRVETLKGKVQVRGDGRNFVVTLTRADGTGRQQFEIETEQQAGRAFTFAAEKAETHYWRGHLVVVAPAEGKALHFSVDGIEQSPRAGTWKPQIPGASELAELDDLLRTNYDLTRIETVTSLVAKNEQALRLPAGIGLQLGAVDADQQDYGTGGNGSCGTTCSISCGDGSSCSTTCSSLRCARCSCPASCSCS